MPPREVFNYVLWRVCARGGPRVARLWARLGAGAVEHAAPVFQFGRLVRLLDARAGDALLLTVDWSARGAQWPLRRALEASSSHAAVAATAALALARHSLNARYMRQEIAVFVRPPPPSNSALEEAADIPTPVSAAA
jgi:hypothetical protein